MTRALEHLRQILGNRYLPEEIQANGENDGDRAQIKREVGEPVEKTSAERREILPGFRRVRSRRGVRRRGVESRAGLFHGDIR